MLLKLYIHPRCSTCKKALIFLNGKKVAYKEIDITQTPPSKAELRQMLELSGKEVRGLFNTSGLQYRALNLKEELPGMSESKALDLLAENGMLVRRPFMIDKKVGLVGFRPKEWAKAFTGK